MPTLRFNTLVAKTEIKAAKYEALTWVLKKFQVLLDVTACKIVKVTDISEDVQP
jgi:hypothetical protein